MNRFIEKFAGNKYLNHWAVFGMDAVVSMLSTLVTMVGVRWLSVVQFPVGIIGRVVLLSMLVSAVTRLVLKTYKIIIRYSTLRDTGKLCLNAFAKTIILYTIVNMIGYMSWHQVVSAFIVDMALTRAGQLSMRIIMITVYDMFMIRVSRDRTRVLIYGTEVKSVALEARLRYSEHYAIRGFLEYGTKRRAQKVSDLSIFYFNEESNLRYVANKMNIKAILFPNYETAKEESERLIHYCESLGLKMLIAPPIDQYDENAKSRNYIREVRIEDLLGRDEIKIEADEVSRSFEGKAIMVTGAAGSIGSELCRQIAQMHPNELILFDNAETPMHNLRLELESKYPDLIFTPYIGDVRFPHRVKEAFRRYRPQIVFHAAAYKHVPLMEENPCEAVYANVIGSRNIADMCVETGVEKMIMVSTDKAVNPTNVMGASKRLAEIYVQSLGVAIEDGKVKGCTKFVTTRFGNVLGSNGSVIPRFREQIANGGPITVTHPDIVRFFMTIPEACRLVMEAATMPTENKICVFDMGEAVKITDLAIKMIKLAGLTPDKDIKIKFTGLRPGEKLYEEVLSNEENTIRTSHEKIRLAKVRQYDYHEMVPLFDNLAELARKVYVEDTVRAMKQIVPEFISKNSEFEKLDNERKEQIA
ncbi:MAG: polysaccharide biosynthesis protein [Rikenellaceae bacterium]|nr:polysaccharide biosynthesis protein [Rikenellaceae bacterium]